MIVEVDDVIQIIDESNGWYPCILVVSEIKSFGVQAYIPVPGKGDAYYRINNGEFEVIGKAKVVAQ